MFRVLSSLASVIFVHVEARFNGCMNLNKRFIVPRKWKCDSPRILDNLFGMKLCAITCRSMIGVMKNVDSSECMHLFFAHKELLS